MFVCVFPFFVLLFFYIFFTSNVFIRFYEICLSPCIIFKAEKDAKRGVVTIPKQAVVAASMQWWRIEKPKNLPLAVARACLLPFFFSGWSDNTRLLLMLFCGWRLTSRLTGLAILILLLLDDALPSSLHIFFFAFLSAPSSFWLHILHYVHHLALVALLFLCIRKKQAHFFFLFSYMLI